MNEKPQRQTVRAGQLDRTLQGFHDEIRAKTAALLERYHILHVAPLEARLAWLELPWYGRLRYRVGAWWSRVSARFVKLEEVES